MTTQTTEIKIATAEGTVLDYVICKIEHPAMDEFDLETNIHHDKDGNIFSPSTLGNDGVPIIFREAIATKPTLLGWIAIIVTSKRKFQSIGPDPLIAAMRCFAISKLGETALVPTSLLTA